MRPRRASRLLLACPTSGDIFPRVSLLWKRMLKAHVAAGPGTTLAELKFRDLSEMQVLLALKNKDMVVAAEIVRLVAAYFARYRFALEHSCGDTRSLMVADIASPIQKVAVDMLSSFMRQQHLAGNSQRLH